MINVYPVPGVVTTDVTHQRVHEGRYFSGGEYNAAIANGGILDILIQSSTQSTHIKFSGTSGGDASMVLYENTTFSAAGTAVVISNHNRSSSKVFSGTITATPTITVVGTQVNGTIFIAGGSHTNSIGGSGDFNNEFILAASTNYLLRITNNSGAATKVETHIECYQPNL